ncbi:MAG: gephyrin-like molybdotransferase Glp, partial [Candidatus Dormibacteria bacterium]
MTAIQGATEALASVAVAQRRLLDLAQPLGAEAVALEDACGRVLAEPVRALSDLPRFDNSAMDGYAVRAAEIAEASGERPARLPVRGQ